MKILKLIKYFIKTEIISVIEFTFWLSFVKDWDFYIELTTMNPDLFGLKYGIMFLWAVLPVIFAYYEYKSNQKEINEIFR
jgi:hypothetical protein